MNGVHKEEYFSILNADNFKNKLPLTPLTYTTTEPLADDTFSVTGNMAHVKAVTQRGYFIEFISGLIEGDVLEVECEVRNISGVKAKIGIDEASGTSISDARTNVWISQSLGVGEWETLKCTYIVTNSYYSGIHSIALGTFSNEVSEFYIRKIRIKANKQMAALNGIVTITSDSVITKYADGFMEIESKKNFTDVSVTNAWGNVFTCTNIQLGAWAEPFINVPTVSVVGISDNSSTLITSVANAPTATQMPYVGLLRGTVTASPIPNVTFHVIAKGRWK